MQAKNQPQKVHNMTLQQLEYVVAVDKYRHFVKAAESCGVTQSTLSSLIRKFEEELDITIFDRNAHPVCPTLAGEQIIGQAKVILYNARQLNEMSQNERKRLSGEVRMAITPTTGPYILPKLFSYIRKGYPEMKLKAHEMHREDIIAKLKRAELDIAIMSIAHKNHDLLEIPLYHEKLVAYVSPHDELYRQKEINASTMPVERLWALKHEICFQEQIPEFCDNEELHSAMGFESGCMAAVLMIVDENGGFTVMPELHEPLLRESMRANIRPLVDPVPTREVSLFVRKDYVREGVLNVIADAVKSIIPYEMLDERLLKYPIRL